jgi:hypothetical protein
LADIDFGSQTYSSGMTYLYLGKEFKKNFSLSFPLKSRFPHFRRIFPKNLGNFYELALECIVPPKIIAVLFSVLFAAS